MGTSAGGRGCTRGHGATRRRLASSVRGVHPRGTFWHRVHAVLLDSATAATTSIAGVRRPGRRPRRIGSAVVALAIEGDALIAAGHGERLRACCERRGAGGDAADEMHR